MIELERNDRERAYLVGVGKKYVFDAESGECEHLAELSLLADTAGADVVGMLVQSRDDIEPTYYIGSGKADELKMEVERTEANVVIFDNDLTPAQGSNLEKLLEVKVIDRSGLILDIFALRARSRQAKTQVELAQLQYTLPRLTRQWTHLSRQQGGIGLRGPGETQLEVDRRRIRQRIKHLQDVLTKIDRQRETGRMKRRDTFKAALVGYTNAGKSTLLNVLSDAGVPVENKLFKTLDSVTRAVAFETAPQILVSDTVGFIRNLPHDLVASFKSTLDEVREADILIHVIDITNHEWLEQMAVVDDVLADLGAEARNAILVFNKIDRLPDTSVIKGLRERYERAVMISCHTGEGIDDLKKALTDAALKGRVVLTLTLSPQDGPLLSEIYRYGTVIETHAEGDDIVLTFSMPRPIAGKLKLFDKLNA